MREYIYSVPVQVIEIPDGVVLKRGCNELKICGADAKEIVRTVLMTSQNGGATTDEIASRLSKLAKPQVEKVIAHLLDRGFLVSGAFRGRSAAATESHLDIFFWHFDGVSATMIERFKSTRILIVGINYISRQLIMSLLACGQQNFQIIDDTRQRNLRFFDSTGHLKTTEWGASSNRFIKWQEGCQLPEGDCLIATSDFGGQQSLLSWNRLCLQKKIKFMPITLTNFTGLVGPLVIPGETACYMCFLSRQRSHSTDDLTESLIDSVAFEGQHIVGFHPSMASILGDIAAFELTRHYTQTLPGQSYGRILEVNLLAGGMTPRRVLKVPRCSDCSPFHQQSSLAVLNPGCAINNTPSRV
ncbi:MAG: TOMM precursor leader peptide-binding protein [Nitrospirota bacterium]